MLSRSLRILFISANIIILIFFICFDHNWGWLLLLPLAFLIYNFFRISSMWLSYRAFQRNDYEKMGTYLDEISFPSILNKKHKAKYYLLQGYRYARNEEDKAISFIEKSLSQGLNRNNDKAIAYGILATLYLGKEPSEKVYALIDKAEKNAETENIIKMVEKIKTKVEQFYGE